jgi:uncharacterized protein
MESQQAFYDLLKKGNADDIIAILKRDPSLVSFKDSNGVSLLLLSFYFGNKALAEFILSNRSPSDIFEAAVVGNEQLLARYLEEDLSLLNEFSSDGFTPLGFSAYFNRLACARYLLEKGANSNIHSRNSFKVTPLHSAVASRSREISELLLKHGADPNAKQQKGITPLHSAAHNGDIEIAGILLKHGANPSVVTDDGKSPMDMAKEVNAQEVMRLLEARS